METTKENMDSALTRRIMRRVYLVAAIRYLLHPVFLKALIVSVFFWRSTSYVSYTNVIANAPSLFDIKSDILFYQSALMNAEATALMLLSGIIGLIAWISYDMSRKRSQAWI